MTETIATWDETVFLNSLPALRLAFTSLTPRESRSFADTVFKVMKIDNPPPMHRIKWNDRELQLMKKLKEQVKESLKLWGM